MTEDVANLVIAVLGGTGDQGRGLAHRFAAAGNPNVIGDIGLLEGPNGKKLVVRVILDQKDQLSTVDHPAYPNVNQKVAPWLMTLSAQMSPWWR